MVWRGALVHMVWVTCTSVNAPLMLHDTCRFWSNICCPPDDFFFKEDHAYFCKTMTSPGAKLACLLSRPVTHWKHLPNYETKNVTKCWTVEQLKSYINQKWENISLSKLQQLHSLVPKHASLFSVKEKRPIRWRSKDSGTHSRTRVISYRFGKEEFGYIRQNTGHLVAHHPLLRHLWRFLSPHRVVS